MFALINLENKVLEVREQPFEVHSDFKWIECGQECQRDWVYMDNILKPPYIKDLTNEEIFEKLSFAVKEHLNLKARELHYDSELHCTSYANSTNIAWMNESRKFIQWRDSVWLYFYSEIALIQSGTIQMPTVDLFIEGLPLMAD